MASNDRPAHLRHTQLDSKSNQYWDHFAHVFITYEWRRPNSYTPKSDPRDQFWRWTGPVVDALSGQRSPSAPNIVKQTAKYREMAKSPLKTGTHRIDIGNFYIWKYFDQKACFFVNMNENSNLVKFRQIPRVLGVNGKTWILNIFVRGSSQEIADPEFVNFVHRSCCIRYAGRPMIAQHT